MPAILTEIGFMSNAKDRAVMITKDGQNQIANRLFTAFCNYKKFYEEGSTNINVSAAAPAAKPAAKPTAKPASSEYYSIQILSVNKILDKNAPDLKGAKNYEYLKSGNLYKYMIGKYATKQEAFAALAQVKEKFAGAFVIHVKNKEIVK